MGIVLTNVARAAFAAASMELPKRAAYVAPATADHRYATTADRPRRGQPPDGRSS
jgi:hypothetical protein